MSNKNDLLNQSIGFEDLMCLKPVKVVAITSGKGGVGKSNIAINLAIALANKKNQVLVLDANTELPCLDVMLGLSSRYNVLDVIRGICRLNDTLLLGPSGIQIIPGSSDVESMTDLGIKGQAAIIDACSSIKGNWNYLIIDTGPGVSDGVLSFTRSAQEIMLVLCNEPASLTGTYGLIKQLNKRCQCQKFHVLVNMIRTKEEGLEVFYKLLKMVDHFLDVRLDYLGSIPFDDRVHLALNQQKPVLTAFPESLVAKALEQAAMKVNEWPINLAVQGNTSFFIDRLIV